MKGTDLYEARASLSLRIILRLDRADLFLLRIGQHDEALADARNLRDGAVESRTLPCEPKPSNSASLSPSSGTRRDAEALRRWDSLIEDMRIDGITVTDLGDADLSKMAPDDAQWFLRLASYDREQDVWDDEVFLDELVKEFGNDRSYKFLSLYPGGSLVSSQSSPTYRAEYPKGLKDYIDGRTSALPFNLPPSSWAVIEAEPSGPVIVRGGPGSGKTLVALYHAIHAVHPESPLGQRRVLYLTFTNQLVQDAQHRVHELLGEVPPGLSIKTVDKAAREFAPGPNVHYKFEQLKPYASVAIKALGPDAHGDGVDEAFLVDEVERVIYGRGLTSCDQYLSADREGRKVALDEKARLWVWRCFGTYCKTLRDGKVRTRGQVLQAAIVAAMAVPADSRFDLVVVDEVQDLTAADVAFASRLARCSERGPNVVFCGDTAQSIYQSGFRWADADLGSTATVLVLDSCERTTREIMAFCNAILGTAGSGFAETTDRSGLKPRIVTGFANRRAQYKFVADAIFYAISEHKKEPSKFAVIARHVTRLFGFANFVKENGYGFSTIVQKEEEFFEKGTVKLITPYSAKGLEFDAVFILCADDDVFPEKPSAAVQVSPLEFEKSERRLLYVACTRPRNILQIVCGHSPSRFIANCRDLANWQVAT